ncbi:U3 small nucleolar ribonucleoprotein protein IMP4 [Folsomia candida]|uniref:U3 small nucleolar ribonucleoprotein IMP4 n=1 Tax=Folsomia candida TaxID=158441 RepID=A0A226EII5_FOLCA|nr:U3 small nucleolar ribonucleoprotein protein IMP4 [Folsomia candida]OXA57485.1 U3 small nucleolar ribonucleoprotein IMP4 [Folsomia candida]
MLRRESRLRREFIYRKGVEDRKKSIQEKKERLKRALDDGTPIDTDLKNSALSLQKSLKWDDKAPGLASAIGGESGGTGVSSQDDEYRWAGVEDPKVVLTTSRDPSARLKMFTKEMRLLVPNCQRINRGGYELGQLVGACRSNGVTDLLIVQEHRGEPDGLTICHLPYGPTAYFTISGTVMRHDIPGLGHAPQQYPHLVFHNFKSPLGTRVSNILKYLFPVPKVDSKRVITFANHDDYIAVRHHVHKKTEDGRDVQLSELGPRFQLKLYEIKLGTLENAAAADVEWAWRPYMNTARKRRFLSDDDGWTEDADIETPTA